MTTDMIDRIRQLIAKAESSPYPAEAESFMAKAQQLIDLHAIDQARLHGVDPSTVSHETRPMTGSYSAERAQIWAAVAQANRCRVLTLSGYSSNKVQELTLIGRGDDRDLVALVATSLELQAMRRLADLVIDSWGSAVVQKRSFLRGFANEVADRLRRAKAESRPVVSAATSAALELAEVAVDSYVDSHFDVSSRRSQSRYDGRAYSKGRRAGASADVGGTRIGHRRPGLPSAR